MSPQPLLDEILAETNPERSFEYATEHGLLDLIETAASHQQVSMEHSDGSAEPPLPPNWVDLVRLHRLIRARRVTTVLEFGVGYSTLTMAHSLKVNKAAYRPAVEDLRRGSAFQVQSVDDVEEYVAITSSMVPPDLEEHIVLHHSTCEMGTFNDRACTFYSRVPNISPDLIYLDGPSQFTVLGDVRGISTRAVDRVPMSGDILTIEHFLLPGTLILVDGRTANARFLVSNLQRDWHYRHFDDADINTFELREEPLGDLNRRQLRHAGGGEFDRYPCE